MEQIITDAISQILIAIVSLGVTYALFLIAKAKAKLHEATIQQIKDENQQKLVDNALDRISTLATNIVAKTEQNSAQAIREAVKSGTVSKVELIALGKNAVKEVYAQLTDSTKSLLQDEVVDLEKYITDVVEKSVLELKNKQ
jgi:L-lactate utilization protein LutC